MNANSLIRKTGVTVKKPFFTTREAGVLLGVSVGTVQLLVESGLLQAWKTAGGHRRILRDSVDRLLQKKPPSESLIASSVDPVASRPLRIVVVDDDEHMLALYKIHMGRWPMAPEISIINNAVTALLHMGRQCPDLLVADLHMPCMDGFNMLSVLGSAPEMANTRIVVVSALESAEIQLRGGVPPGIEVLPKPVPFDRLLAIATDILQHGCFQRPSTGNGP